MKTNAKYEFVKMAGFEGIINNNTERVKQQFSKERSQDYLNVVFSLPSSGSKSVSKETNKDIKYLQSQHYT